MASLFSNENTETLFTSRKFATLFALTTVVGGATGYFIYQALQHFQAPLSAQVLDDKNWRVFETLCSGFPGNWLSGVDTQRYTKPLLNEARNATAVICTQSNCTSAGAMMRLFLPSANDTAVSTCDRGIISIVRNSGIWGVLALGAATLEIFLLAASVFMTTLILCRHNWSGEERVLTPRGVCYREL